MRRGPGGRRGVTRSAQHPPGAAAAPVAKETLEKVGSAITTLPDTFAPHRMVGKIYQARNETIKSDKQIAADKAFDNAASHVQRLERQLAAAQTKLAKAAGEAQLASKLGALSKGLMGVIEKTQEQNAEQSGVTAAVAHDEAFSVA